MNFKELLIDAKTNNESMEKILEMYKPLLLRESVIYSVFNEDLFQELCIQLVKCVKAFKV